VRACVCLWYRLRCPSTWRSGRSATSTRFTTGSVPTCWLRHRGANRGLTDNRSSRCARLSANRPIGYVTACGLIVSAFHPHCGMGNSSLRYATSPRGSSCGMPLAHVNHLPLAALQVLFVISHAALYSK